MITISFGCFRLGSPLLSSASISFAFVLIDWVIDHVVMWIMCASEVMLVATSRSLDKGLYWVMYLTALAKNE